MFNTNNRPLNEVENRSPFNSSHSAAIAAQKNNRENSITDRVNPFGNQLKIVSPAPVQKNQPFSLGFQSRNDDMMIEDNSKLTFTNL